MTLRKIALCICIAIAIVHYPLAVFILCVLFGILVLIAEAISKAHKRRLIRAEAEQTLDNLATKIRRINKLDQYLSSESRLLLDDIEDIVLQATELHISGRILRLENLGTIEIALDYMILEIKRNSSRHTRPKQPHKPRQPRTPEGIREVDEILTNAMSIPNFGNMAPAGQERVLRKFAQQVQHTRMTEDTMVEKAMQKLHPA